MQWLSIAATCVVAMTLIGCFFVFQLVQVLRREERIVQTKKYGLIVSYQRFTRPYIRNVRFAYTAMVIVALIILEFAIFNEQIFASIDNPDNPFAIYGLILCTAGLGILIASTVYTVLRCLYVDAPALRLFRLSNIPSSRLLSLGLKRELPIRFASVLLLELVGGIAILGAISALWLVVVLAIVLIAARVYASKRIYMWSNVTTPLSQSAWAEMEPRVREWAQGTGVEFEDVHLLTPTQPGMYCATLAGVRRPILFLNEFFLRQTDWRQHDALVVHSLLMMRQNIYRWTTVRAYVQILTFTCLIVVNVLLLNGNNTFFLFDLVLFAAYYIFLSIYRKRIVALYMNVDRQTINYTGDPYALMVMLNSAGAISPRQAGGAMLQIRNLEALMQQSLPRAPWSRVLAASAIPMMRNGYAYTVSLSEALPLEPVERRLE